MSIGFTFLLIPAHPLGMGGLEISSADHAEDEIDRKKNIVQVKTTDEKGFREQFDEDRDRGGKDRDSEQLGKSDLKADHSGENESNECCRNDEEQIFHCQQQEEQDEQTLEHQKEDKPTQIRYIATIIQDASFSKRNCNRIGEWDDVIV